MHKNLEFILRACTPNLPGQALGKPSFFNVLISPITSYQKTCGTTSLFLPTWPQIQLPSWSGRHASRVIGSGFKFGQIYGMLSPRLRQILAEPLNLTPDPLTKLTVKQPRPKRLTPMDQSSSLAKYSIYCIALNRIPRSHFRILDPRSNRWGDSSYPQCIGCWIRAQVYSLARLLVLISGCRASSGSLRVLVLSCFWYIIFQST